MELTVDIYYLQYFRLFLKIAFLALVLAILRRVKFPAEEYLLHLVKGNINLHEKKKTFEQNR